MKKSKTSKWKAGQRLRAAACSPFRAATGLLGATESGQRVTAENVHHLPTGSVVRLDSGGVLIHLHDELWYYNGGCAWCYDNIERHKSRLPGTLCHIPANAAGQTPAAQEKRHE